MGKFDKSSHQIIALVSLWICCLLLLLSFNTVKAAFTVIKTGVHQAYASWNSPAIKNYGQSGLIIRSDSQFDDLMAGRTMLDGLNPVDSWGSNPRW